MRICVLSTGHEPHDDRIYYKEVLSLAKKHDPIFLLTPKGNSDGLLFENGIRYISLGESTSLLSRCGRIPKAIANVLRLKPEVLHLHDYELIFALPLLRLLSNTRIIYDVHELYPEMMLESRNIPPFLRPSLARLADLAENMLSRLAHGIVASDESIAERFAARHRHVQVIFNYPRLRLLQVNPGIFVQLRREYAGRIPIIYHGSMSAERGLFLMLAAMSRLRERRPELLLLLIGRMDASLQSAVIDFVQRHSLQQQVELIGWVPHQEIASYIAIAKIGLVPLLPTKKFMKNIPIKQFEYMACGVPVLGANLPPISTYLEQSGSGKTFEPASAESLAQGILDMLADEAEWQRMSRAGKEATARVWNWDQMEDRLFTLYDNITENGKDH